MKRLAILLALSGGCAKHPVATVAVASGSIALLTCEINGASFWDSHDVAHVQGSCGIVTGAVVLVLGGLAALVTHFADTEAHELEPDEELTSEGAVKLHTHTAPPPVPNDAGVEVDEPAAPPVDAAVADGS